MIALYPYKSDGNHAPLRYSLRSLERFGGVADAIVVGTPPPWFTGIAVRHMGPRGKIRNATSNVLAGLSHMGAEHGLLCNDDMFLLAPYNPGLYARGTLGERGRNWRGPYRSAAHRTARVIGQSAPALTIHAPMPFRRDVMHRAIEVAQPDALLLKSVYAWLLSGRDPGARVVQTTDRKVFRDSQLSEALGWPWFSTGDRVTEAALVAALDPVFPEPSRWEK